MFLPGRPAFACEACGQVFDEGMMSSLPADVCVALRNTFIDVPSGFSPSHTPTDNSQPVSTAPAQAHQNTRTIKDIGVLVQRSVFPVAPGALPGLCEKAGGQPHLLAVSAIANVLMHDDDLRWLKQLRESFAFTRGLCWTPLKRSQHLGMLVADGVSMGKHLRPQKDSTNSCTAIT